MTAPVTDSTGPGSLSDLMDFDVVVEVHPDGTVERRLDVFAPEVFDDEVWDGWTLLNGYSGQQGYSGPIMHASEQIAGGLARDIVAEPGLYVAVVAVSPCDECGGAGADEEDYCDYCEEGTVVAGWAIARKDDD